MDNALTPIGLDSSSRLLYNTNYALEYKSGKLQVVDSDGIVPPNGSIAVPGATSPFKLTADGTGIKFGGVMLSTFAMSAKSAFVDCRVSIKVDGVVFVYAQFAYTEDIIQPSVIGVANTIKKGTLYSRQYYLINTGKQLGELVTSFSALGPGKLFPLPRATDFVLTTVGDYSLVSFSTGVYVRRNSDSTVGWRATCKYIYIDPSGNLWFPDNKYWLPTQMVNWGKPQTGTASSARLTLDTNGKLNLFVGTGPQVYQSTLEPVQDCVVTWGPCTSGKQTATITKNPTGFGAKQCPALTQDCSDCVVTWGPCTSGKQTATITTNQTGSGTKQCPALTQDCNDCVFTWGACTSGKQTATITKNPTGTGTKQCPTTLTQNCNDCVDATPSPGMCINGKNEIKYSGWVAASVDSTKKTCRTNDTVKNQTCTEGLDGTDNTIEMYTALVATIKAMGPASSSLVSDVDAAWTKLKGTQSLADQTKFIIAVKAFISGFKGTLPPDAPGRLQLLNMQLNTAADLTAFLGAMNAYKSIGASSGGSLSAPINCVGSWSDCVNGSQAYAVTTPAANWGLACPAVAGATKTCGIPCVGSWSDCVNGSQAYAVTTPASSGGLACPAVTGATKTCAIPCVGSWSDCVNGSQTYTVTTPASNGGAACPAVTGATKTCGTPCEGTWSDWAACANGKQTQVYNVTKQPTGGGKECPTTNTRDCGTSCVGNWAPWSACDPKTGKQSRTYLVATQASGGGLACPSPLTESQTCAVDCVGAWDSDWSECINGSQTKMYTVTTEAFSGGRACSDKDGDKKTQSCKTEDASEAPKEVKEPPAAPLVEEEKGSNIWLYVGCGVLLLIVLIVAFMVLRKKK